MDNLLLLLELIISATQYDFVLVLLITLLGITTVTVLVSLLVMIKLIAWRGK
ncbi:MAG: hypothetical protein ACI9DG_001400 [Oleispira sp.]|jgi:hypothetical protein